MMINCCDVTFQYSINKRVPVVTQLLRPLFRLRYRIRVRVAIRFYVRFRVRIKKMYSVMSRAEVLSISMWD